MFGFESKIRTPDSTCSNGPVISIIGTCGMLYVLLTSSHSVLDPPLGQVAFSYGAAGSFPYRYYIYYV
jgi:hypothetical protein